MDNGFEFTNCFSFKGRNQDIALDTGQWEASGKAHSFHALTLAILRQRPLRLGPLFC